MLPNTTTVGSVCMPCRDWLAVYDVRSVLLYHNQFQELVGTGQACVGSFTRPSKSLPANQDLLCIQVSRRPSKAMMHAKSMRIVYLGERAVVSWEGWCVYLL